MESPPAPIRGLATALGSVGRAAIGSVRGVRGVLEHVSGIWHLFALTLYYSFVAPFRGRSRLLRLLMPMLSNVGVRSFPIVCLISFLIGAILVIQTGEVIKQYGQIQQLPKLVALSMTREFGPVMTSIIMTARVGASFTAVLASMKINEELMALETMAIHPIGYLVAPRFLAMLIMMPCLTVLSYLVGMVGGGIAAWQLFDFPAFSYFEGTINGFEMVDLLAGLMKAVVFSVLISIICCYYGVITEGGPMGLGRNTMVAVVTSLVVIIIADALLGAFSINYLFD